jgi:hypothetical protein
VRLYLSGTRGSTPATGPDFIRYGGRTSCLAIAAGADRVTAEAREILHQGGRTFGYRVSDGRSTVAYLPDHCPTRRGPGPDGWGEYHPAALALARRADVLIHDAFWRAGELVADAALGHAAAEYAVALGARAGAARVALSHWPDRTDDELDRVAAEFADAPLPVTVAADGEVLAV